MSSTTFSHQLKDRRLRNALDTILGRAGAGEEAVRGWAAQKAVLGL